MRFTATMPALSSRIQGSNSSHAPRRRRLKVRRRRVIRRRRVGTNT